MKLSYELIRKIHRLEKQSVKLVKLEDDFFDALRLFLEEEKENIKNNDNVFDDSKTQRLFNIKNMLDDILALRQKKIINLAIIKVKTGDAETYNMLLPEQKMFNKFVDILQEYRSYIQDVFGSKKIKKNYDLKKLKMLQEVPKFIGTDMKEYGPYSVDDEIEVPESIAKLFINKGIAKEI